MLCCAISDSNPLFLVFFRPTPQCHNSIVTLQQHNYSINVYNLFHGQSVPTSQDVLVFKSSANKRIKSEVKHFHLGWTRDIFFITVRLSGSKI